jgi:hypothetical protein
MRAHHRIGARHSLQLGESDERRLGQQPPVGRDRVGGGVDAGRGFGGRLVEQRQSLGLDVPDHRVEQVLAAGEMVEHRPARDPRRLGDHCVGGALIAGHREEPRRRLQDPRTGAARLRRVLHGARRFLSDPSTSGS